MVESWNQAYIWLKSLSQKTKVIIVAYLKMKFHNYK